ncbi:MAG: TonB family protein [Steroidobacteraceae bacterium]
MASLAQPLEPPARPLRRRADRAASRVTRDRLASMLMLAVLLHGIVILGITFAPPGQRDASSDPGIEVLLVSDELPEERSNPDATYLAQRTQSGSGNSSERRAAEIPSAGRPQPPPPPTPSRDTQAGTEPVLSASAESGLARIVALPLAEPAPPEVRAAAAAGEAAGDDELRLRGERRDELYVTADTRASRLAPYLDAWRRRVERIGTVNYPSVAQRRGLTGNPVIEVALHRDGHLQSSRIIKSSGHPEIDAAALDILRLASPFDPFPPELARDYRLLRFAYEWQFVGGRVTDTAVSVPREGVP